MTTAPLPKRTFSTTLRVRPVGKGRPRATRQGHVYTPAQTVSAEAEIRWLLLKEDPPLFEGPVFLHATFTFRRPKSAPKSRIYPTTKPDADNALKLLTDAMNGVCFVDDKQVVIAHVSKVYGETEGIELLVGEL